jgi:hypothetical protein
VGHHCTVYSEVLLVFMLCLGCLEGYVCVILATGVLWDSLCVSWRREVICGVELVGLLVCGLARLVRSLMVTCMGFIVGVMCIVLLVPLAVPSRQVVNISGCLEAKKSCSGVGLGSRIAREFDSTSCQRLVTTVDRGSGLNSVSVRAVRCSGEIDWRSSRR